MGSLIISLPSHPAQFLPLWLPHPQAELLLSDESRERASVAELKLQLQDLQQQVAEASKKLQATQERVQQNLDRVAELKAEAAALERLSQATPPSSTTAAAAQQRGVMAAAAAAATPAAVAISSTAVLSSPASSPAKSSSPASSSSSPASSSSRRPCESRSSGSVLRPVRPDRGLRSSLVAEPALKEFWYPAEFSSRLQEGVMVPFELFDEPWVLFRWGCGVLGF